MTEVVFFLEEPSAEAMLKGFLPKVIGDIPTRFIPFEGKQDLENQLVRRMRHYRVPNAKFVVLRDKDAGDCSKIKVNLLKKCTEAGYPNTLIRIVCHELESWYLADLVAVEQGLQVRGLTRHQKKKQCTAPDNFPSPFKTLRSIVPSYQKVSGSRAIGPYLDPDNKVSKSFSVFVSGIKKLCAI
jgi:hypothetical protein